MATSVIALSGTIPAGTPVNAPVTVGLPVGTNLIDTIRWRVPPGPRGHLGWFLSMGGVQVLPQVAGEYIIADDEYDEWSIQNLPDSGAWQLTGYNTGSNDHTVYFQFHVTPIQLGNVLTANVDVGFPTSEADIPTMWLNPVNPYQTAV